MEAMDKRKKDRLTKGIVLNVIVFALCIGYIMMFIMPKYDEMGATMTKINDTTTQISSLRMNGVNRTSFEELLNRLWKKKEVPDVVFSDSEKLSKVLTKPVTAKKDYLAWLIEENGKVNALDQEIQENDKTLGNIIPIFINSSAANSSNDVDNQINLSSFISYVERDILSKYTLTSYAPLGISNIVFPDKKETPVNIGSFKINLDFKGKNSNIFSLVDALQNSGKITIRNGKLISETSLATDLPKEKGLSSLSNLLVNIDAFSLDSIPDVPSKENKGSMSLEFYVEGMNYQKIIMIRSLLTLKFDGLQKSVKENGFTCTKPGNPLCNETITSSAIASIKGLTRNLTAIKPKIDAFNKGDITIDVNKEMDTLSDIRASLQTIEMAYLKNYSILEKAKKPSTK